MNVSLRSTDIITDKQRYLTEKCQERDFYWRDWRTRVSDKFQALNIVFTIIVSLSRGILRITFFPGNASVAHTRGSSEIRVTEKKGDLLSENRARRETATNWLAIIPGPWRSNVLIPSLSRTPILSRELALWVGTRLIRDHLLNYYLMFDTIMAQLTKSDKANRPRSISLH